MEKLIEGLGKFQSNYIKTHRELLERLSSILNRKKLISFVSVTALLVTITPLSSLAQTKKAETGNKQHPIAAGTQITSGFGWRSRPAPPGYKSRGKRQFHAGVDFAAPMGTPVRAIAFGVVVKIGGGNSCPDFGSSSAKLRCGGQLGNWIDIRHSDGTISRYGHLQQGSILVRSGMIVSAGQEIGAVGNSGYSTGPHLDFRVHNGKGDFFDPAQVIPY